MVAKAVRADKAAEPSSEKIAPPKAKTGRIGKGRAMNGVIWRPPKKERGVGTALKTAELLTAYRFLSSLQAAVLQRISSVYAVGWKKSGEVLLQEFRRSGRLKFLRAFLTHLLAILAHETEASR